MISITKLEEKIKEITKPWNPINLEIYNDQVVRLALFKGEYKWHKHDNEDELFLVYKGRITIQLEEENITLKKDEMYMVPKGVMHCPKSDEESYVLMFEPYKLKSNGN